MDLTQLKTGFNQWISRLLGQPPYVLVLQLTAVIALLHGIDEFQWFRVPERILAIALLFIPGVITQRWIWLLLSTVLAINTTYFWYLLVNHEFLITYWVIVCTMALYAAKPERVMAANARWLIALCFVFATAWKFMAGEYVDGSFLHLTFLLDERLEMGATLFGRVGAGILQENQAVYALLQTLNGDQELSLLTTALMSVMSVVLSYWTIAIEGAVAIAFLLPRSVPYVGWFSRYRDGLLLLFIFTTYSAIPVFSFAAVLLVMGLIHRTAQSSAYLTDPSLRQSSRLLRVYVMAFVLSPLWMLLPLAVFYGVKGILM